MRKKLRIATRESPLALWQAHFIKDQLQRHFPSLEIDIIGMTTAGDKILNTELTKVGGKGLFIKELEDALLNETADIAVHSMKDMTVDLLPEFDIAAICKRSDPKDAFVSPRYASIAELPENSRVGTSSLRRKAQLLAIRQDLQVESCRGNINTRLEKLHEGHFDALLLAAAGLNRLGFSQQIRSLLSTDLFLPAIAQGALGIECLKDKTDIRDIVSVLSHTETRICVSAERAINQRLNGGCSAPIAGYATIEGDTLLVRGLVGSPDGTILLKAQRQGKCQEATQLGLLVAEDLLKSGAEAILQQVR